MTETNSDFHCDIDIDLEKAGILAYYSEFLSSGRAAPPMLWFWRGKDRILGVTCRNWDDEEDKHRAIMEMLFMSPALMSTTMVLSMVEPVKLVNGIQRCVIMVVVTCHGALSIVSSYDLDDETNEISFDHEAELDPLGGGAYSEVTGHMLGVFARQRRAIFTPPQVVQYLSAKGFEIEFYENNDMSTISAMG
jgi:hypothetical protein